MVPLFLPQALCSNKQNSKRLTLEYTTKEYIKLLTKTNQKFKVERVLAGNTTDDNEIL